MHLNDRIQIEGFTGGVFLAKNPEVYGPISDTMPLATDKLLLAVNGFVADDGMQPPTFTVGGAGVEGLYTGLYKDLLERNPQNESILRLTFGESEGRQVHPMSRYCAAMTEAVAYQLFYEDAEDLSMQECAALLSEKLPREIRNMRETIRSYTGPRPGSERFFAVSFFACRTTELEPSVYELELYSAGHFCLFLLDEIGLSPIWTKETEYLTGDETAGVVCHRITLQHESPFMLLLLSRNACEPTNADRQSIAEHPGYIWRHRMKIEDHLYKLLSTAVSLPDFAEKASAFYKGKNLSGDSASGAASILSGTFDEFKAICHERSRHLEDIVALFPSGYDPRLVPTLPSEDRIRRDYVSNAFKMKPGLLEKTMETLSRRTAELLESGSSGNLNAAGCDGIRCLTYDDVAEVYHVYDRENTKDREGIAANERLLCEWLSEHWMTLRPCLCGESDDRAVKAQIEACTVLKNRIAALTSKRRRLLRAVKTSLSDHLDVLGFQENAWIHGRGGDDSTENFFNSMSETLPLMIREISEEWHPLSEQLRSIQSAYTQERERLFLMDVSPQKGVFAKAYEKIISGTLPEKTWQAYREALKPVSAKFLDLLSMIKTLSLRNRALWQRIEGRAAERRTLQAVSENAMWQTECMLGSLHEEAAWGETCVKMIDTAVRNEYRAYLRRMQEEKELIIRQKEEFAYYKEMYERFESSVIG